MSAATLPACPAPHTPIMRLLHTSDWHLGRVYHGTPLLEDQAYALDQVVSMVRDYRPDAVLIAGDLYDRAIPPGDAVRLLDETLTRLVIGEKTPVIAIAGNHDGPDRLGFGSRLLASAGLCLRSQASADNTPVILRDAAGEVAITPLPYAEPALLRPLLDDPGISDHHAGMAAQLQRLRQSWLPGQRQVIVAHAFVHGGVESESERALSVGGSGAVGKEVFSGADFVALGHLHRPQDIGPGIHYAGSLLKYSFAEADHRKSLSLVTLDAQGHSHIERLPLTPRRDLRIVEGPLHALLAQAESDPARDDYLLARLTDEGALLDAMPRLRQAYPNALAIERPIFAARQQARQAGADHRRISTPQLFGNFFQDMTGNPLSPTASQWLAQELDSLQQADRESQP